MTGRILCQGSQTERHRRVHASEDEADAECRDRHQGQAGQGRDRRSEIIVVETGHATSGGARVRAESDGADQSRRAAGRDPRLMVESCGGQSRDRRSASAGERGVERCANRTRVVRIDHRHGDLLRMNRHQRRRVHEDRRCWANRDRVGMARELGRGRRRWRVQGSSHEAGVRRMRCIHRAGVIDEREDECERCQEGSERKDCWTAYLHEVPPIKGCCFETYCSISSSSFLGTSTHSAEAECNT